MIRATWHGTVIAESDRTTVVEGNHYFPPEDVDTVLLTESATHTSCPWKGEASYYNVVVNGAVNADAAWTYPNPTIEAREIKDRIAFWRGVEVREVVDQSQPAPGHR